MSCVATKTQYAELLPHARNREHGHGRAPLVDMLWRMKTAEADVVIMAAIDEPDVTLSAMTALRRRLGNGQARVRIALLTDHHDEHVRTAARLHLGRIDA